ncbi:hypothetical protein FHX46_004231 [Amycolatopsis viridis]|uniref:Uncharacterized protein n=1 Tax=Amycolatopsis viridis TaxID=185678 RepID=A0ABX0SXJ9_9PSEU|nr:hypothetical protein [Amycolatopsis viridis]
MNPELRKAARDLVATWPPPRPGSDTMVTDCGPPGVRIVSVPFSSS